MFDLLLAAAAAPIAIELPAAVSAAAWVVAALLAAIGGLTAFVAWFLRREVNNNDAAHTELRRDVKKLLEAVGRIEGILTGRSQFR